MDNELINISPYQMFLLHIRSPKTKSQYIQKFEHFFNFLAQQLGEKEFETENIEKKYFLLYEKAKSESWLFNCMLKYVHFINKRVETENLSGATFYNYFKNIKKFCLANDIEVKWHKLFLSAPKKRRAAIDRPPTVPEIFFFWNDSESFLNSSISVVIKSINSSKIFFIKDFGQTKISIFLFSTINMLEQ